MNIRSDISTLKSDRLLLLNSTEETLQYIVREGGFLTKFLHIHVPEHWTEFGLDPFKYVLERIKDAPENAIWWNWLPILVSENTLIGNCGYKGPPVDGVVEIGYEVARDYRGLGYATEMASTLVAHAFTQPEVHTIHAHTLPEENDSVRVLRKCGFHFASRVEDPDDGTIWKWQLDKR